MVSVNVYLEGREEPVEFSKGVTFGDVRWALGLDSDDRIMFNLGGRNYLSWMEPDSNELVMLTGYYTVVRRGSLRNVTTWDRVRTSR